MRRIVEPEILDYLDPEDPSAIASRKDLRRLNGIMGHAEMITNAVRDRLLQGPSKSQRLRIGELGGGDGTFLLRVARRWSALGVEANVQLVDRNPSILPKTVQALVDLGWSINLIPEEAVHWLQESERDFDFIFANLFLHHFERTELQSMLDSVATRTRIFVACEPRRNLFALSASRLVGFVGCNSVTRNDAVISVRAGFKGKDLSQLWPSNEGWVLKERRAGLFSHLFLAV